MADTDRHDDSLSLPEDTAALDAAIADLDPEERELVEAIQALNG